MQNNNWDNLRFGDVCKVQSGFAFRSDDFTNNSSKGIAIIRMNNLKSGRISLDECAYIPMDKLNGLENYALKPNDFLFGMSGSLDNFAVVQENDIPCYLNQRVGKLVPLSCDSTFAKHLFLSNTIRNGIRKFAAGNAQLNVSPRQIESIRVLIPPREEQEAIARILDAVDAAIERTREAVEKAREAKKALIQHLFERGLRKESQRKTAIGLIPKSWSVVPLHSVVTQFQYGLSVAMNSKGEYPILRMGNIQAGEVLLDDLKYLDLPKKIADAYLVRKGDVLFNRTNSQEHVGKVGIYRNNEPVVFASYLIRLFPDPSKVNNYYLGQFLSSYPAQCRIKRYATPGVQQVNVNARNLGRVIIPVPLGADGLQEQEKIAKILEQADEKIRCYNPVLDAFNQLKKSLMHDLLTGKVRVNNNMNSHLRKTP